MRALVLCGILLSVIFSFLLTSASAQQPSTIPFITAPPSPSASPPPSASPVTPGIQGPATPPPAITAPPVPADPGVPATLTDVPPMPPGGPVFAPSGPGGVAGETRRETRPPAPAGAGQPLPIEVVQRVGLEANGLVRAARSQIDMAEAGVVGASAYPNPGFTFMGGSQHARIPSALPADIHRQFTVAQTIENPFLRSARIGSAEAAVDSSRASLDQVRADLAALLRVRAYELLLRQEIARMETSIHDLMEDVRRRIAIGV